MKYLYFQNKVYIKPKLVKFKNENIPNFASFILNMRSMNTKFMGLMV